MSDLAVIDDRNRHAPGVGVRHDLTRFGIDGGAIGNRLCDNRDRKADGSQKNRQKRKNLFRRSHGDGPSRIGLLVICQERILRYSVE